jgi:hypothetical protein
VQVVRTRTQQARQMGFGSAQWPERRMWIVGKTTCSPVGVEGADDRARAGAVKEEVAGIGQTITRRARPQRDGNETWPARQTRSEDGPKGWSLVEEEVEGQARPPRGRTRGPASSMLPARAAACSSTRHARSYRAGTPQHSPSRPGASARAARSAPARAAPKPAGEMDLRRPSASCARSSRITGCGAHRVLPWVFAFKELGRASGRMVQALFSDGLRKVPGQRVVKSLIRQRRVPRARREA